MLVNQIDTRPTLGAYGPSARLKMTVPSNHTKAVSGSRFLSRQLHYDGSPCKLGCGAFMDSMRLRARRVFDESSTFIGGFLTRPTYKPTREASVKLRNNGRKRGKGAAERACAEANLTTVETQPGAGFRGFKKGRTRVYKGIQAAEGAAQNARDIIHAAKEILRSACGGTQDAVPSRFGRGGVRCVLKSRRRCAGG